LAEGLATVARAEVRGSGAQVNVAGQFGLDAAHSGALTYSVVVDSLGTFARFLPASAGPDTGAVPPRPRILAEAVQRSRSDVERVNKQTEVARAIRGAPPMRVQVDTPQAIPRNVLAGSLRATGTITGSIERFKPAGLGNAAGLIVRGNAARHITTTYNWTDARTPQSKMTVAVRGDTISALGFAFDSLAPTCRTSSRTAASASASGRATCATTRSAATSRSTTSATSCGSPTWRCASTRRPGKTDPSVEGGDGAHAAIEVVDLELTHGSGRIYANGLLPTEGRADFDLQVRGFAVENVAELPAELTCR
jgi:hypothetical protein